jgi:DNA-binding MurR/RpiR family transcriptional regulator
LTEPPPTRVDERIVAGQADLTPSDRRVAEVVLANPEGVAFGTVAEVARQAGTSGPSVVRFANRLGYDGFVGLQAAIRTEVGQRLRPAAERIRERPVHNLVSQSLTIELDNVQRTLDAVDDDHFRTAVGLLAGRSSPVRLVSGDPTRGLVLDMATALGTLRPDVGLLAGSEVQVARELAHLPEGAVLVAVDLRRYERWVVETVTTARANGARVLAITDSALSPLAVDAAATFLVTADSAGPFDSQVGTLALINALVAGVSARLRRPATERVDRVEAAWRATGALLDP